MPLLPQTASRASTVCQGTSRKHCRRLILCGFERNMSEYSCSKTFGSRASPLCSWHSQKMNLRPKRSRRRPMPSVVVLPAKVAPLLLLKFVFWKLPRDMSFRTGSGTPRN